MKKDAQPEAKNLPIIDKKESPNQNMRIEEETDLDRLSKDDSEHKIEDLLPIELPKPTSIEMP